MLQLLFSQDLTFSEVAMVHSLLNMATNADGNLGQAREGCAIL